MKFWWPCWLCTVLEKCHCFNWVIPLGWQVLTHACLCERGKFLLSALINSCSCARLLRNLLQKEQFKLWKTEKLEEGKEIIHRTVQKNRKYMRQHKREYRTGEIRTVEMIINDHDYSSRKGSKISINLLSKVSGIIWQSYSWRNFGRWVAWEKLGESEWRQVVLYCFQYCREMMNVWTLKAYFRLFFTTFYCIFLTWEPVKLLHGAQASVLLNAVLCGIGNIRF